MIADGFEIAFCPFLEVPTLYLREAKASSNLISANRFQKDSSQYCSLPTDYAYSYVDIHL